MAYQPPYPQQQPYPSAPPGYDAYQQGPPPPGYSPYPQQQYGQGGYGPPPQGGYGPPPGQYGPPGSTVYTQQPNTVYVYDERQKRRDTGGEECFLWGLCAACLCCCLLND